jgi:putative SOS response-associated peptidase YedK
MCGRFAQTNIIKATSDIVKTVIGKVDNIDNFNISPGQEAAVIKKYSNGRALELGSWSIFPSWAKDKEGFRPLHNTRLESLVKPYFKRLISTNRLLIPCSYFYEWSKSVENKKVPYCFKLKDDNDLMYFAGVFENNQFSIITREADGENSKIHHRQPLIINQSKINDYLNLRNNAQEILQSIKPPDLNFYQIGLEINNPKNNFKELINPLPD